MKFLLAALGYANAATSGLVTPTCGYVRQYYKEAACTTAVAAAAGAGTVSVTVPAQAMNTCVGFKTSTLANADAAVLSA